MLVSSYQVAQRKWTIVSESLRSLTKNERMSESLIFGQKTSDSLGKPMSEFPAPVKISLYRLICLEAAYSDGGKILLSFLYYCR